MTAIPVDATPLVPGDALPDDVRRGWRQLPSGRMRALQVAVTAANANRAVDELSARAPVAKSHRPDPSSTALVAMTQPVVGGGVTPEDLAVAAASDAAAAGFLAARAIKPASSRSEVAAFDAAYRKGANNKKLFSSASAAAAIPAEGAAPTGSSAPPTPPPAPSDSGQAATATATVSTDVDHLGRSFMHCDAPYRPAPTTDVPSRLRYVLKGHEAGVHALQWIPGTAHLLLSGDLGGQVRLWDVAKRRQVGVYSGHATAVRSVSFSNDGRRFSSGSVDGTVREWDTETGAVLTTLRRGTGVAPAGSAASSLGQHVYCPDVRRPSCILAGVGNAIVQWDTRTGAIAREYEAHSARVLHVGFLNAHTFASSSEDKSLRTWDIDSSVTVQDFTDSALHVVSHFARHPTDGRFAAQAFDDTIHFFAPLKAPGKYRLVKDVVCKGHRVSGSSCRIDFSPNGRYISSGDVRGELHVWDAATCQPVKMFRAHGQAVSAHLWHPIDGTLLATASWDGTIKLFSA